MKTIQNNMLKNLFPKGMRYFYLIITVMVVITSCEEPYWGGKDPIVVNHDYYSQHDSVVYHHYTYDSVVHFVYDSVYTEVIVYQLVGVEMETEVLYNEIGKAYAIKVTLYTVTDGIRTALTPFTIPYGLDISMVTVEVEGGFKTIYYYESGKGEGYQEGDDGLVSAFIVRHGKDGIDGQNGRDGQDARNIIIRYWLNDAGDGMYFLAYLEGEDEPEPILIQAPKGADGQDGQDGTDGLDAINVYPQIVDLIVDGEEVGYTIKMWRDTDDILGISKGDELAVSKDVWYMGTEITHEDKGDYVLVTVRQLKYGVWTSTTFTIEDGSDGADGQDGQDGNDGQDGADGKDDIHEFTVYRDTSMYYDDQLVEYKVQQTWLDLDENYFETYAVTKGDSLLYEVYIPISVVGIGESFVCFNYVFEFENMNKPQLERRGFTFDGTVYVSNNGIFTLSGTFWTYNLRENSDLLSVVFKHGSNSDWKVHLKAEHEDGSISTIDAIALEGNSSFDWKDPETYTHYAYYADPGNPEYENVVKIGFTIEAASLKKCTNKDWVMDRLEINFKRRNE